MKFIATLLSGLAIATTGDALGINCRGNASCKAANGYYSTNDFNEAVKKISSKQWFENGEHIACFAVNPSPGLNYRACLFAQGSKGVNGVGVKRLMPFLKSKCGLCGSVPLFYPESNDPSGGILTINIVSDTRGCNWGLCK